MNIVKKKFKVPIYDQFNLTIIITDNLINEYSNITGSDRDYDNEGLFLANGNNTIILINAKYISYGIIAHEAFHAVKYIMDDVGMKLSDDSEEAYTYLLQWIVNQTTILIDKYKEKYERE